MYANFYRFFYHDNPKHDILQVIAILVALYDLASMYATPFKMYLRMERARWNIRRLVWLIHSITSVDKNLYHAWSQYIIRIFGIKWFWYTSIIQMKYTGDFLKDDDEDSNSNNNSYIIFNAR